jgi:hypothetical protein
LSSNLRKLHLELSKPSLCKIGKTGLNRGGVLILPKRYPNSDVSIRKVQLVTLKDTT